MPQKYYFLGSTTGKYILSPFERAVSNNKVSRVETGISCPPVNASICLFLVCLHGQSKRNQRRRLCHILVLPVPSTFLRFIQHRNLARFRAEVVQSNTAWSGIAVDHEIQVTLHRFVFEASSRIQRRQTTKFAKSNYFSVVLAFGPLDNLSSNKFLISARETLQMMIDNRLRAIFLTVEKPPLLPTLCHNFALWPIYKISEHYLAGESKTGCYTAHCSRDEVVQVSISWCGELQSSEADIVQSFIVDAVRFIGIFNQLMDGQRSVVRLHNSVRYFRWWYNAECVHDSVGIFFSDLGNKEGSHARAGSTAQRVCKLKALKAVAAFCFFSNDIQDRIYQFSSLSVMAFCPVVSSSALAWGETWRCVNSLCRYLGVASFQTNL